MRIVIIGNGVAGIEAALVVREREPEWDITIISEESDHFFSRTALMWVLCGQLSHRCIEPYERDLYERMDFTRVRARAVAIDVEKREVRLAGGLSAVLYDRLLIASGSIARRAPWPGADLAGVGPFVTMQDLEWLERELFGGPGHGGRPPRPDAHLARSTPDSPYRSRTSAREHGRANIVHPAVIGGGLIGTEAIEVMLAAGLRPRFFVREEWFWPMSLDAKEARFVAERLREHGVDVRLSETVEAIEGDERVARVRTDRSEHECDLLVVAIGVVPNTDWLASSAIERTADGGILVDAALCTSAPDVFAAGDCASVPFFDGTVRAEQLWYTARGQGRVAGRALCGDAAKYERGIWYNSAKLMDIEYTTVGFVNENVAEPRTFFHEEQGAVRSTTRIVLSGERVVGFNLLGRRWDHSVFMRWIDERRSLSFVLAHLAQASFDTELVPPLHIPAP